MPRRNFAWLVGIALTSLFCWAIAHGSIVPPRGPLQYVKGFPGSNQDYERLSLIVDAMEHVEQYYVHELSDDERNRFVEHAIQAGLQSLDSHSSYFSPREYKQFSKTNEGTFGGIGVQINVNRETRKLVVITPMVGTPAYKAGIKPGDEIEKINGEPTTGMSSEDAVDKITGPPGTQVTLTVRHRGSINSFDVTLTRSIIEVENLLGDRRQADQRWDFMLDHQNKIGYVRMVQFNRKCVDELASVLKKLREQGACAVVLDLRGNGGGLLDAAVGLCELFLNEGNIVTIEGRTRHQTYKAEGNDAPFADLPLAVLIDEQSASASEIVAAALQDHQRAIIVGERSFGKGSVQNLIPMQGGKSALKLTTAKYLRPSGKNIHRFPEGRGGALPADGKEADEWGVKPDVRVDLTVQEKIDYFIGRRDRDIIREGITDPETVEQLAMSAMPLGAAWSLAGPCGNAGLAFDAVLSAQVLPKPKKPYVDRVLDKAVELLLTESRSNQAAKK